MVELSHISTGTGQQEFSHAQDRISFLNGIWWSDKWTFNLEATLEPKNISEIQELLFYNIVSNYKYFWKSCTILNIVKRAVWTLLFP